MLCPEGGPGPGNGVVHAIAGRAACGCGGASLVRKEARRPRAPFRAQFLPPTRATSGLRSWRRCRFRSTYGTEPGTCPGCRSFTARQPSRSEVSRRAQRCQCSPLRFDPAGPAGPTGIDSACARQVMGNCAMAYPNGFGPSVSGGLTRDFIGRILIHRVCAARHILRFALSACGARFPSSPTGHTFERTPKHRGWLLRSRALREHA